MSVAYTHQYLPPPGTQVQSQPLKDEFGRVDAAFAVLEADILLRARTNASNTFLLTQNFSGGFSVGAGAALNFTACVVTVPTNPTAAAATSQAASEAFVQNAIAAAALNPVTAIGARAIRQARWAQANLP